MALGDKLPVVMGKEKAVAGGVATLGPDGILREGQRPPADAVPTDGSSNLVQSGGVYSALLDKADLELSNLSNRQKALASLGGRPRKNLIRNWYFGGGGSQQGGAQFPINQQGQTSYTSENYSILTIDRWRIGYSCTLTLDAYGIALTKIDAGSIPLIDYNLPTDIISYLSGKTITLSVLTEQGLTTGSLTFGIGTVYGPEFHISVYNSSIFRIVAPNTSLNNTTSRIIAAKLEIGEGQTLAYQDSTGAWQLFETPDYTTELLKCRRYLYVQADTLNCAAVIGSNGTDVVITIPIGVEMANALNLSYDVLLGCGPNGIIFDAKSSGVFTLSAVRPAGATVYVYGVLSSPASVATQGFTAAFNGLVITGTD